MSAYIVEDSTINRAVTFLKSAREMEYQINRILSPLGYDLSTREGCEKLASDLYLLNCDAVDDRYGKGTSAHDTAEVEEFRFRFDPHTTTIQAYKSLQCLSYQCSEGDVPARPLYKAMEEIENLLAHHIVSRLTEYDKAIWG